MRYWPHGSVRVPVDQMHVGDIVVVPGAGAYRITRLMATRPLGLVAVLGWDDLALILRPGTYRDRLNPAPDAARHQPAGERGEATDVQPDQHQLAG